MAVATSTAVLIGAAVAAGAAGYSASEQQKATLASDDRRKNAEIRQGELIQEEKEKKRKLEARKAMTQISANQRILARQTPTPVGVQPANQSPLGAGQGKSVLGG